MKYTNNMKHGKNAKALPWWLCLCVAVGVSSCDLPYHENLEVYNGTPGPITVVLGKDLGAMDSLTGQNFLHKMGCGQNIQHLGNNFYVTACPLEPGARIQLHSYSDYGQKSPRIGKDQTTFNNAIYDMFDTLYVEGGTLLKNPKLVENWPVQTKKREATYTFSISPEDIQ